MTTAAVVYGVVVATVGGVGISYAVLAYRVRRQRQRIMQLRTELRDATLAHARRRQAEADAFEQEFGWVE